MRVKQKRETDGAFLLYVVYDAFKFDFKTSIL